MGERREKVPELSAAIYNGMTPTFEPNVTLRPAVFLDRDGTLNMPVVRHGKPFPPQTLEDFQLYSEAADACMRLVGAGYVLVVATNQPDVGRGTQQRHVVEAMHDKLLRMIPAITRIEVCYDPGSSHEPPGTSPSARRKPAPGMLLDAAALLGLNLAQSWMIGDRWLDLECGKRAGVRTVFIDLGYSESLQSAPDFTATSIGAAASIVLAHTLPQKFTRSCDH
jgi:D-glycero-D-manno-heptose 1,7-bisphosphate phosphatase